MRKLDRYALENQFKLELQIILYILNGKDYSNLDRRTWSLDKLRRCCFAITIASGEFEN